jgi:hypothetical protein
MDKLEVIFDNVHSIHDIKLYDLLDINDMLVDRIKIFDYFMNQYERQIDEYHPDYFDVRGANVIREVIKNEIQNYIKKYKRRYYRLVNRIHSMNNIVFVYMGKISDENSEKIESGIKTISKKKVPIICLDDFGKESLDVEQKGMIFKVNYNKFYNCPMASIKNTNWIWMNFLDWEAIFKVLMNIHHETITHTKKAFL